MASMITKDYKIGSFFEFLQLRNKLWQVQFNVMVIVACIGFPTTMLQKYRLKLDINLESNQSTIVLIDKINFWVFFIGFFKDHRGDV